MLILYDQLVELPILSLQTGTEIARTSKPIIEPNNLFIIGFYCEGDHLDIDPAILHTTDIREFSNLGFIVDSSENLMSPEDLVRLQQILQFKFELIDKLVVDDMGNKIGKVNNYIVDTASFLIKKICVRPRLLQSLGTSEIIIDRTQIIKITETQIVVKAPTVAEEQPQHVKKPIVDSPFPKIHAQPDAASTKLHN